VPVKLLTGEIATHFRVEAVLVDARVADPIDCKGCRLEDEEAISKEVAKVVNMMIKKDVLWEYRKGASDPRDVVLVLRRCEPFVPK
jgi:hypothetical protein